MDIRTHFSGVYSKVQSPRFKHQLHPKPEFPTSVCGCPTGTWDQHVDPGSTTLMNWPDDPASLSATRPPATLQTSYPNLLLSALNMPGSVSLPGL